MTYKVGDRVEIVKPDYSFDRVGYTGTVEEYEADFKLVAVRLDPQEGMPSHATCMAWNYYTNEIRPLKETEQVTEQEIKGKAVYAVQLANGLIHTTTDDRDLARYVKSELGGLAKGVKIIRYAPVKEIR